MRFLCLTVLALAISTGAAAVAMPQGSPPKPAPWPPTCIRLIPVEVPGENHQWARILTGDKWIPGCLGPVGKCFFAAWVPC